MERIILDKLNWDLHTATPLDFLHIFHAIAVSTRPQLLFSLPSLSPSQHLAFLTKQLLHCMACSQLLQFKGSMLALAMVSLEMEKLIPDWLPLTIELLQKAQMDSSQLIHCRELVAHHLSTLQSSSTVLAARKKQLIAIQLRYLGWAFTVAKNLSKRLLARANVSG